jgi:TonB family protein
MNVVSPSSSTGIVRRLFEEEVPARRRSPAAGTISLALHAAVIAAVVAGTYREFVAPEVRPSAPMRYVRLSPVPLPVTVPLEFPRQLVERPRPPVETERPAALVKAPEPAAQPVPEAIPALPRPSAAVETRAEPVSPEPPREPAPPAPHAVQPAGFDALAATTATPSRPKATTTGLFETRPTADTFAGVRTVAATAFDAPTRPADSTRGERQVASSGFEAPAAAATASAPARQVVSSGFADVRPATMPTRPATPSKATLTPVEVLFKPVPLYTDAARQQRIEGAVILEVEFAASGAVRVLRVVKGLGHGLDEMASQAAAQIRFKPALEHGQPVDHRASIQIVFRLT